MKLKITLILALVSALCSDLIAGPVVIMRGGGSSLRCGYIEHHHNAIYCSGTGSLICPVMKSMYLEKGVSYQVTDVIDFVSKQIEDGERTGSTMYEDAFKINWESLEDGLKIEADVEKLIQTDDE